MVRWLRNANIAFWGWIDTWLSHPYGPKGPDAYEMYLLARLEERRRHPEWDED